MNNGNSIFSDLKNSFRRNDNAIVQLIIINVVVFLGLGILRTTAMIFGIDTFANIVAEQFVLPADFFEFIYQPWTILTYAFNHLGILHILFNMLFLYWFGLLVVDFIGGKKLISIYVLGALAGGVSFLILYYVLKDPNANLRGASGAVYAIMVAAATIAPNYQFFLFLIGPVRVKYIVAIYIVLSYIGLSGGNAGGNLAHLSGALVGYAYVVQLRNGYDLGAWIHSIIDGIKDLFSSKPKPKVPYRQSQTKVATKVSKQSPKTKKQTQNPNAKNYTPDQAEIDAILDKISEKGYESLSKEEKQKLFKASKN